jgi:hypothetical protein
MEITKAQIRKDGHRYHIDYKPAGHIGWPYPEGKQGGYGSRAAARAVISSHGWTYCTKWS